MRKFVLLGLRAEAKFVNVVNDFAQVVAALNLVLNLAKDFANLVFDGVWPGRPLLETVQVGKELAVDKIAEIVAGQCLVVVELAVLVLWRGPRFPAIGFVENVGIFFAVQRGFRGLVLFKSSEIFQEKEP